MPKKVCIDAGHYGKYNKCPNNSNYYESEVMWKLHLLQKKYLEQLGVQVITTRNVPSNDLDLVARGKKASGCDLFISDHTNAVGSNMNEEVDYVAIYCLTEDSTTKCDDISKEFSNKIGPVIAEVMNTKQSYKVMARKANSDRNKDGLFNDNYYGVLHGACSVKVPAVILEHSFHTNSRSVEWLLDDSNLDKLAKAEAECIAEFLKAKTTTTKPQTNKNNNSTKIYRVQTGAFSSKSNAENQLKKIKDKGFDAVLVLSNNMYKVQIGAFSVKTNADRLLEDLDKSGFKGFITTAYEKIPTTPIPTLKKSVEEVAQEILKGLWGNGDTRKLKLIKEGYDYNEVQAKVNELLKK